MSNTVVPHPYSHSSAFDPQSSAYLRTLVLGSRSIYKPIKCQCCRHIETSQLICIANQFAGFYVRATLAFNGPIDLSQSDIQILHGLQIDNGIRQ